MKTLKVVWIALIITLNGFSQQANDLAYGKFSKEDIASAVQFEENVCNACDLIRIDHVGSGKLTGIPIVISEKSISGVDDYWKPDTTRLHHETFARLIIFINQNNTNIGELPSRNRGTIRILTRVDGELNMYFVRSSLAVSYFEKFEHALSVGSDSEKLLGIVKGVRGELAGVNKK